MITRYDRFQMQLADEIASRPDATRRDLDPILFDRAGIFNPLGTEAYNYIRYLRAKLKRKKP